MIVFETFVNGKRLYRAGVGEEGTTLYAGIHWVADIREHSGRRGPRGPRGSPFLKLDGRTKNSYMAWPQVALSLGDRVLIKVSESRRADQPSEEEFDSNIAAQKERWERQMYRRLKRKYESPRGKGSSRR